MRFTSQSDRNFVFCAKCRDLGATAIVLCDRCSLIACIHSAARVGNEALCSRCLEMAGHEPPSISSWFWPEAEEE